MASSVQPASTTAQSIPTDSSENQSEPADPTGSEKNEGKKEDSAAKEREALLQKIAETMSENAPSST